jgi:hypothetical protein
MSDDNIVTFMNNNKSLLNSAYSSTCIILFTKRFYLRLKAAFVSFLLIWLKVIFFVKDSEVSFATLRLLGMTLVPLISHWTSLLVNWFSSDNCKQYYKCALLNGTTDNRIPKLYWALNCKLQVIKMSNLNHANKSKWKGQDKVSSIAVFLRRRDLEQGFTTFFIHCPPKLTNKKMYPPNKCLVKIRVRVKINLSLRVSI